jgi:hypothetical protein
MFDGAKPRDLRFTFGCSECASPHSISIQQCSLLGFARIDKGESGVSGEIFSLNRNGPRLFLGPNECGGRDPAT